MKAARLPAWIAIGALAAGLAGLALRVSAASAPVYVVPVRGTVDATMARLVGTAVAQANAQGARAIVLDIDSGGGLLAPASAIRDALLNAREPVIAYVDPRAYSVAALVALAANRVVMAPGGTIGDAEPNPPTDAAISSERAEFASTALRNHRDPNVAAAMVDKSVALPLYKRDGTILTLDEADALRTHVADATAGSLDTLLAQAGLASAPRIDVGYGGLEALARFATSPAVSVLLLALGLLGLLIEMQTLHGIAGAIGIAALTLFFGAHVYAGFASGLVIVIALIGLIGILWELHVVPGHGLPGVLGGLALLAAVVLAFGIPFFFVAVETLATAIVLTAIGFSLLLRQFPENAWMRRLALTAAQGADYVTSRDFHRFLGATGEAASFLRPAGIATVDGERLDVLTEGEFIAQGTPVRVTRVEGARIFVETAAPPPIALPPHR